MPKEAMDPWKQIEDHDTKPTVMNSDQKYALTVIKRKYNRKSKTGLIGHDLPKNGHRQHIPVY